MFSQSFSRATAAAVVAILSAAGFGTGQAQESALKISRTALEKSYRRVTSVADLDRKAAFHRLYPYDVVTSNKPRRRPQLADSAFTNSLTWTSPSISATEPLSLGTGGGDANEVEPNDPVAQTVSLPVNIFGEMSFDRDFDYFAFQAIAGQQITIEPFAARLRRSTLVAAIALFDSSGRIIDSKVGDESNDPLIRFTSPSDQILLVGISDADGLGGKSFDYILNIARGNDIDEQEPNGKTAQELADLPATVFGEIGRDDVDFFSFTATAGQTLIVDVDAEVLGSRLDAEINLSDPASGIEFFYSDQFDGNDPRFNIVLPYTGRYVIGVGAFISDSSGFYRINASLVPSLGAPIVNSVTKLAKKLIEVSGEGFASSSRVEVNGIARKTTMIDSNTLRAKVKAKTGNVVTVSNPPDERRSNPLLMP
jgi:hypothetical protein